MQKILRTLCLNVCLALGSVFSFAGPLDFDGADATSVGIYIEEIATGKVVASHNAQIALTPASVTKALTCATALSTVGPDFRFETRVALSGERDQSNGKVWHGDLLIFSSGDPTLGSSEFKSKLGFSDSIISHLRRLGINDLRGSVIVVETMKDAGPIPQWEIEDVAWPYGAGLHGFNYAGNCVRAYPNKGITKPASNLTFKIYPSSDGGTDLIRGINSNELSVWASAQNRKNENWNVGTTVPDPAGVYEARLLGQLRAANIKVSGKLSGKERKSELNVYTHTSPRSAAIMENLMKRSDNLFAEGILRTLAPGGSRSDCLKAQRDFWASKGLNSKHTAINDGSGLTRSNKISPIFLGKMLRYMAKSDHASTYVSFFPKAGMEGTMKGFMAKTRLKGRLAFKTGSVSGVQAYAGYKLDSEGKPTHIVVIMVNGFFCPRASLRAAIEKFLLNTL